MFYLCGMKKFIILIFILTSFSLYSQEIGPKISTKMDSISHDHLVDSLRKSRKISQTSEKKEKIDPTKTWIETKDTRKFELLLDEYPLYENESDRTIHYEYNGKYKSMTIKGNYVFEVKGNHPEHTEVCGKIYIEKNKSKKINIYLLSSNKAEWTELYKARQVKFYIGNRIVKTEKVALDDIQADYYTFGGSTTLYQTNSYYSGGSLVNEYTTNNTYLEWATYSEKSSLYVLSQIYNFHKKYPKKKIYFTFSNGRKNSYKFRLSEIDLQSMIKSYEFYTMYKKLGNKLAFKIIKYKFKL